MTSAYLLPLGVALALFCALWPLSVWRRDASLVDLFWGPGFLVQLGVAVWAAGPVTAHGWLLLAAVGVWSLRLGAVLGGRRLREAHEDARYQSVRVSWGASFWWKSLFIVFALQAFLQWLIALGPISGALAPDHMIGVLAWGGTVLAMAGLGLETLADRELDRFKRTAAPGDLLQSGLRAHVRHPNYTGEIIFWSGIALICVDAGAWLGLLSPVLLVVFLTKVSGIPLLDERLTQTRPAYQEYRARVPAFLPRL